MTIRASFDVFLGRTKRLGGLLVLGGRGLMVETGGSGVGTLALGFERVVRAMVLSRELAKW